VLPIPEGYDDIAAAAVPETFFTVWTALYDHGRLKPGESLLVHGGSSGIGTTAIMLARALGAGAIFATAGSAEKCARCETLGATRAINYRSEDFAAIIRKMTAGAGVDVILDMVAGPYIARNIGLLADDGRLVFIGRMSQQMDFAANVSRIMYARLVLTGVSLRGQTPAQKSAIARQLEATAWPLLASRQIAPVIDTVFPLAEAAAAHRRLESSVHIGKLILQVA
jgi:NADPH:quinone reductase-like Zn-dependent oxidoreductase